MTVSSATKTTDLRSPFVTPSASMSVMAAIYARRAVRNFLPDPVPATAVQALMYAAVQAPTALHEEPWAFVVVQDRAVLDALSDGAYDLLAAAGVSVFPMRTGEASQNADIFHGASTLIAVAGYPKGRFSAADCWLAAENIMLAAVGMGLGTCPIGLAVDAMNTPEWKERLAVPRDVAIYAPIIVGTPATAIAPVTRKPPQILSWTGGNRA